MYFSEWVKPNEDDHNILYVWGGSDYPGPRRPALPCAEHGGIGCDKHISSAYPETRTGLTAYRIFGGLGIAVPTAGASLGMWWLVYTFGMWVVYAPVLVFVTLTALYGLGWGGSACYRLVRK